MFSIFKTLVKAKPQPQKHGQNHTKFTAYRICKIDLQPQNTQSTNINHKGLQRTAIEYAAESRIYKDLISKNNK